MHAIMRAFVRLRRLLGSNTELERKLAELERRYDVQFKAVFDAIRQLMATPQPPPPLAPGAVVPCQSVTRQAGPLGMKLA
jgi:hypothetical protein